MFRTEDFVVGIKSVLLVLFYLFPVGILDLIFTSITFKLLTEDLEYLKLPTLFNWYPVIYEYVFRMNDVSVIKDMLRFGWG